MIGAADFHNARILVVDDLEPNVTLLVRMLQGAGYAFVSSTTDPRAVCELHRTNRYALILLDLQMPGMDGFQVMEGLKEIETDSYLSVLAVTAQPDHRLRALKAGAKDFVSKPFDLAEVLLRVHNLLEVRLLHEAARIHAGTLEALALQDPLTGLANRRSLAERMRVALAHGRMSRSAMAVVYLDLDGFKEINEKRGHGAGDALLQLVAARLVATVRGEDTVARLGGDEFMVALWHVSSTEDATLVAGKLIEVLSRPYPLEGEDVSVTASAGISIYPVHGEDARTLMESADQALGEAKRAGKNTFCLAGQAGPAAVAHTRHDRQRAARPHDLTRLSMTEIIRLQNELSQQLTRGFETRLALAFSDMVGSTPYFQKFGDEAGRKLQQRHVDLLNACLPAAGGRLVDTAGDGAFLCFPSVDQAIEALTRFRKAAAVENASAPVLHQLHVRVGLHWGVVLTDGVAVTGDAVNLAARVAGTASPGEIRITAEAFHEFRYLLHRLNSRPLGAVELKGSSHPMDLLLYEWRDLSLYPSHVRIDEMGLERELPGLDAITFGRLGGVDGAVGANDVVLSHPTPELANRISRWHFELRRHPDGFHLRPLSEQPTEVDGKLAAQGEEIPIRPGSVVRVGNVVTLTFFTPAAKVETSGSHTIVAG